MYASQMQPVMDPRGQSQRSWFLFIYLFCIDVYLERLKEELNMVKADSAKISNEIEGFARTNLESKSGIDFFTHRWRYTCILIK